MFQQPQVVTPPPAVTPPVTTDAPPPPVPVVPKKSSGKTFFIALLALILVGGGAIASYVILQNAQNEKVSQISYTPQPSTAPKADLFLTLLSPADGNVALNETMTIEGKTLPNTVVSFFTDTDAQTAESDAQGNFKGTLALTPGINSLTVSAFGEEDEKVVSLDIVYNNQVLGTSDNSPKTPATATTPPGQVKKATVGQVQEVKNNSITVKDKAAKITTTQADTTTQITAQNKKTLKLSEIKANDLVAIIESTESATTKKATKIFVKQATVKATKRQAISGVITNIAEAEITLTHQIQTERVNTILFDKNTEVKIKGVTTATTANLEAGQRVVVVGDRDEDNNLVARVIHVIPGKATGIVTKKSPLPSLSPSPSGSPSPVSSASPVVSPSGTPKATSTPGSI